MIRLAAVTTANLDDALAVRAAPGQEYAVRSVATSLAEAYVHPDLAWPRVVVDDGIVVAFVMAFLDSAWDGDPSDIRGGLWRLDVDQIRQGRDTAASPCTPCATSCEAEVLTRVT